MAGEEPIEDHEEHAGEHDDEEPGMEPGLALRPNHSEEMAGEIDL